MIISRIRLKNWRNFRSVDVALSDRVFLVGPNACGKSNFLDALRFLRDLASDGGGLQKAIRDRGGLSKIRCLSARRYPDVEIEVYLSENELVQPTWSYSVGIKQRKGGQNEPVVSYERVCKNGQQLINRPDPADEKDSLRRRTISPPVESRISRSYVPRRSSMSILIPITWITST